LAGAGASSGFGSGGENSSLSQQQHTPYALGAFPSGILSSLHSSMLVNAPIIPFGGTNPKAPEVVKAVFKVLRIKPWVARFKSY